MSKEKPILFSTPMVKAILEGRKTMTRRIKKDQSDLSNVLIGKCPYEKGMRLWVKETFFNDADFEEQPIYVYKADNENYPRGSSGWKPSIFMPRAASRITLEITNIRVERLQDISEEDSIKEGVETALVENYRMTKNYLTNQFELYNPKKSFKTLWQSINGQESWDVNPWVWAITFKQIKNK